MTERPRKLIEVALPLDEINAACKADKDRKTGTIRNLHKWFAPMPLPAWRALLFTALVDDTEDDEERRRRLDLVKRLVQNGAGLPAERDLLEAREIINQQFDGNPPPVFDPFCGGGSTLVEAQRLGLQSFGSDLNPVPVLISRALTQYLPPLHGTPALNGQEAVGLGMTVPGVAPGYEGLATDVLHYAALVRDQLARDLRAFYPKNAHETPIAWLWGRSAACPNPACGITTLLLSSWWISKRKGGRAWLEVSRIVNGRVELEVVTGDRAEKEEPAPAPKLGRGATFACVRCQQVLDEKYLISEGSAGRIGLRMTAVVAQAGRRRIYRTPTAEEESLALAVAVPETAPQVELPENPRWFSGPRFGYNDLASQFTPRQLVLLTTLADAVAAIPDRLREDGADEDRVRAVMALLGLAVGKVAHFSSTLAIWRHQPMAKAEAALASQAMPMNWDFPEVAWDGGSVGDWDGVIRSLLRALPFAPQGSGSVALEDARTSAPPVPALVATDPPYFDAIGYADLSDYFYVWHRRALRTVFPDLFRTVAAPKRGELTAVPSHHGGKQAEAKHYFIEGFTQTFKSLQQSLGDDLPMLIVYASKEQKGGAAEQTRWVSILTAMVDSGLEITGTWPIHGTTTARMISAGTNAVATYVVMVARPRKSGARDCSVGDFLRALRRELPGAIVRLQTESVLPVDMAQAVLGPGMSIYSRHSAVRSQDGVAIPVDHALDLIRSVYGEVQDEQVSGLDTASQFAIDWWADKGWAPGTFDEANRLARSKGTSVDEVVRAQVVTSRGNIVKLLGAGSLARDWTPTRDAYPTAWESAHHLVDRLIEGGGEVEAAALLDILDRRGMADAARMLAYRLASLAAATKRTKDEERYNALIEAWPRLLAQAPESEGLF